MANLLARLRGGDRVESRSPWPALSVDDWLGQVQDSFTFGGVGYPVGLNQTFTGVNVEEPDHDLGGFSSLMRACPPAFAAQTVRAMVLSQANFTFRNNSRSRTPGRTFGTSALGLLEVPWPNGTTGELLSRMEWHAGLQGNAFVLRQGRTRLRVLRPDWVTVVWGSRNDPESAIHELDSELVGYVYQKGGLGNSQTRPELLDVAEVAHWAPIPDPEGPALGMSWFTPAIREAMGDRAVTEHKLQFFKQGATPNLVVKGVKAPSVEQFRELVDMMEESHSGVRNAYKTLYLSEGADATVVGSNLKDLDLKAVQGGFETRIAYLSRVPAVVLNIAEGMQGSSLNAGNYSQSRRNFADSWVYPTLQGISGALASIIDVPRDADLWFDTSDMPFLRQDEKDAAEIEQIRADTISSLVREGFTAESAKAAVTGEDMDLLEHTGNLSVQLQPSDPAQNGSQGGQPAANGSQGQPANGSQPANA